MDTNELRKTIEDKIYKEYEKRYDEIKKTSDHRLGYFVVTELEHFKNKMNEEIEKTIKNITKLFP